jgi:hypothetical protein
MCRYNSYSAWFYDLYSTYIYIYIFSVRNDFWKVKLQLVDLAGSERVKKTHAEGARLKEGIISFYKINLWILNPLCTQMLSFSTISLELRLPCIFDLQFLNVYYFMTLSHI